MSPAKDTRQLNAEHASISALQAWILAFRPKTLPAAAAPVLVGSAVAFYTGNFAPLPALAALAGGLLLQIGANLANDVYDFQHGADTSFRVGPLRVTQAGLLTPDQVKAGMWLVFGLAALIGAYLTLQAGWPVVVIGLLAIAAAIAYTGGPFPLGYHGLGEVFVFVFFGLVAVTGTYFVQAKEINWYALAASIPIGLLTCALLTVNNLRDIETDRITGKMTLAARFGEDFARQEYLALVALAYMSTFLMAMANVIEPWVVLTWLSLPLVFTLGKMILTQRGSPLNQALAMTGRLELFF
ncbi:MAG TPA: 1,4-dihydroxy-2-naphthoate polyprenyltransferase, partial [Anaerolineaceae bacterium]|nr:1,4-dihydroxy-2-naphthoate polyprenyltransferase [Anaerolineaceae bacterium]